MRAPENKRWISIFLQRVACGLLAILLTGNLVVSRAQAELPLMQGDTLLFLGDSITQDGRYVDLVRAYLWSEYPDLNLKIFNAGLSSETASGLTEPIHPFPRPNINDRAERILEMVSPDWVFVCYGMNDGIYHPMEPRIKSKYQAGMEALLAKIHAVGAKAVLLSPPIFDAEAPPIAKAIKEADKDEPYGYRRPFEQYDDSLVVFTNVLNQLESDPRVDRVIDIHFATHVFLREAKQADPKFVYGDGVHPPLEGHAAIAIGVLEGLGEDGVKVQRTLTWLSGIRPPGTTAEELPSSPAAKQFQTELFQFGRAQNGLCRKAADPKTAPNDAQQAFEEAEKLTEETVPKLQASLPKNLAENH